MASTARKSKTNVPTTNTAGFNESAGFTTDDLDALHQIEQSRLQSDPVQRQAAEALAASATASAAAVRQPVQRQPVVDSQQEALTATEHVAGEAVVAQEVPVAAEVDSSPSEPSQAATAPLVASGEVRDFVAELAEIESQKSQLIQRLFDIQYEYDDTARQGRHPEKLRELMLEAEQAKDIILGADIRTLTVQIEKTSVELEQASLAAQESSRPIAALAQEYDRIGHELAALQATHQNNINRVNALARNLADMRGNLANAERTFSANRWRV